jgi:hypothetical protein
MGQHGVFPDTDVARVPGHRIGLRQSASVIGHLVGLVALHAAVADPAVHALPSLDVIPTDKSFRHVKSRKAVEVTARPIGEIRQLYQRVIAQIALRTLREPGREDDQTHHRRGPG